MDQENPGKREVMDFKEFAKAYERVSKTVKASGDVPPRAGMRKIKAEDAYAHNDANPYRAAGIPVSDEVANRNDKMTAGQVDVFNGTDGGPDKPPTKKEVEAAVVVTVANQGAAITDAPTE